MFCPQCGKEYSQQANFCSHCGGALAHCAFRQGNKLTRSRIDKKIAGVCAGFAEYFDMDVTLVRLIWVGLVLLPPSPGLIIYIVAWIILPKS